jgi:hypothetical protein
MDGAPDHATAARAAHPVAERSRLIFFVGADPKVDPGPVEAARHMATVAGEAGLEGEIRLATGAVRALEMGMLEGLPETISLTACPRSMGNLDLSEERARAAGARPRRLAEILTEVADGRSVLIPVAHRVDGEA